MSGAPPSATPAAAVEAAPAPGNVASSRAATTPPSNMGAKTAPPAADGKKTADENPDVLVVYTGDVGITVDDGQIAPTIDRIIDIGESMGGHLAGRHDGTVTVRVPSPRFHEVLEKVAALGEVTHQSVTAEDVSEEFHDAEVRLQNLNATQKRLQEFLARSANMNDMITLEHELERVSMEIDRIEGRMRFLKDHAAFSTLSVALAARPKPQAIVATQTKPVAPAAPRILPLHADWLDQLGVPDLVAN
ncbi:MAG TPA: DUF4349 domain-containing protein [Polyangiaceae bacterium]